MTEGTTPAGGSSADAGESPEVRVTDKRRIDPDTFAVRSAPAAADRTEGAAAADGSAADGSADAAEQHDAVALLETAQQLAAERLDELQRRSAELYNVEQQYAAYVKRSRAEVAAARQAGAGDVAEALISVLDDVDLARQHGDLTGPFASIAEKLEASLGRFGVERFGTAGEGFDPAVHEALMHSESTDVDAPTVQHVLQPGYRIGDRVLRAARVAVVGPEA